MLFNFSMDERLRRDHFESQARELHKHTCWVHGEQQKPRLHDEMSELLTVRQLESPVGSRPSSGQNTPRDPVTDGQVISRASSPVRRTSGSRPPDRDEVRSGGLKSNLEEFHSFMQTDAITRELFIQYAQVQIISDHE